jgi:hypothetical protein
MFSFQERTKIVNVQQNIVISYFVVPIFPFLRGAYFSSYLKQFLIFH